MMTFFFRSCNDSLFCIATTVFKVINDFELFEKFEQIDMILFVPIIRQNFHFVLNQQVKSCSVRIVDVNQMATKKVNRFQ